MQTETFKNTFANQSTAKQFECTNFSFYCQKKLRFSFIYDRIMTAINKKD